MPSTLDSYNALLLHLYRLSHELPLDQFQDAALELVKPVLPFDSSMWGSATLTPVGIDVHNIHLHCQPPEMLQAYEEIKHLDTAGALAAQEPNATLAFHADSWFAGPDKKPLLAYGKRFRQTHFFIGGAVNPKTRFTRWLTLFRADDRAYCTETERVLLAGLMPHIQQALELNRLTHLAQSAVTGGQVARGAAIADLRGVIYHADAAFEQALRAEWDGCRGDVLPPAVIKAFLQGAVRFKGHSHVVRLRVEHQLLFLQSRPRCAVDELTPREFTVAQLVARGNTHKEIADLLHRAPATVRTQISAVYDKLCVSNVAGLIEALRLVE
ncbi:helix-turn-helix transcriptional regulator [Ottowia thiooxydans]|uniref:helix-turn-helix transcriptional regulator n=1 Tax=Ottowia thiooxydans TaxID=219182 RepID=UPI0004253049|nr:LuxR C-terminal-related transcriptional regulator [Ottowia thiooxydans]